MNVILIRFEFNLTMRNQQVEAIKLVTHEQKKGKNGNSFGNVSIQISITESYYHETYVYTPSTTFK